jgi:4-hydroxybenzoate polyprenyltransferase
VGVAFVCFGLVASALYVVNDLVDVKSDRAHALKRTRPLASGALSPGAGLGLAVVLLAAGATLATTLRPAFCAALAGYVVTTLLYSLRLKRVELLDVLVLAALYTVRIFAGAFAADVPVSQWLASFSLFFFLSLAILKRASEMGKADGALPGRAYGPDDRIPMMAMGVGSGYVSVLVLALYLNSPDVSRLYAHPGWLWALCVLVLYWLSRAWLLAWRGEVHEDPVVFAMRDPVSWVVAVLGAAVLRLGT